MEQIGLFEPVRARRKDPDEDKPGVVLGHEAAERAADKAERESPGWKEAAFAAFVEYGRVAREFTMEDVRDANPRVPPPKELRSWGQVALRAKRKGLVVPVKLVPARAKNVHGGVITLWRWVGE